MITAVGLGSSLGDRRAELERVVARMRARPGVRVLRVSRWYRTPPMRGGTARGWFLNGVVLLDVDLPLEELLAWLRSIEQRAGRRRARFWSDRPVDLDILLAGELVRDEPSLRVPPPGIAKRPFVLVPLLEVWPDARDPRTGARYGDLPPAPGPRPTAVGVARRPPTA